MSPEGMVNDEIEVPEKVSVSLDGQFVKVKGPKGELSRKLFHPRVKIAMKGKDVVVSCETLRAKDRALVGTYAAHIRNMCTGVTTGWQARMKAVHSHFPIKINVEDNKVVIQNFLGGRKPKVAKLPAGVTADVKKDEIIITGMDKELVGQACGNIENVTRVTGRDKRTFQDGVYILGKPVQAEEKK